MITAMIKNIIESTKSIPNNGKTNLSHFVYGTFEIASTAIKVPEVGMTMFEKPSPHVNANTAVCLVTPMRSDNGAISGIVTAACPEPEGIKKFNVVWKISIPPAATNW